MINHLYIGLSGIISANKSLSTIGQNITKSNIPQYHRRLPILSSLPYEYGAIYSYTHRQSDDILQQQFSYGISDVSYIDELQKYCSIIETYYSNINIIDKLNNMYNIISQIPINRIKIHDLISAISDIVQSIRLTNESINRMKNSIESQIRNYVNLVNNNLDELIKYKFYGNDFNALDKIEEHISNISNFIDSKIIHNNNIYNILSSNGMPIVLDIKAYKIRMVNNSTNIAIQNDIGNIEIKAGRLGALLHLYNEYLPNIQNEFNSIIADFIRNINHIQATGLGALGEYTSASSRIPVSNVFAPLSTQYLPYEIHDGDLSISITNTISNTRNNFIIHIEPNIHSLYDVSNMLSSLPGLDSTVDPTTGLITITAQSGFRFDFAGRDTLPPTNVTITNPDTSGFLSALGINGIFDGYNADTINIHQQFIDNPNLFAFSKTGELGNNDNIKRFLDTRNSSLFSNNNYIQNIEKLITNIGSYLSDIKRSHDNSKEIHNEIEDKLNEIIGVDTNEEFVSLLSYQRMLESSSKYLSIINHLFDSILEILK